MHSLGVDTLGDYSLWVGSLGVSGLRPPFLALINQILSLHYLEADSLGVYSRDVVYGNLRSGRLWVNLW